jgi:hypothetical protein
VLRSLAPGSRPTAAGHFARARRDGVGSLSAAAPGSTTSSDSSSGRAVVGRCRGCSMATTPSRRSSRSTSSEARGVARHRVLAVGGGPGAVPRPMPSHRPARRTPGRRPVPDHAASSAMIRSRQSDHDQSVARRWTRRIPSGRGALRKSGSSRAGRGACRGRPGGCCRPGRPCRTRGSSAADPPSTGRWASQVPPKTQCPRARRSSANSASAASASRREPYGPQPSKRSGRSRTPCARTSRDAL